MVYGPYVDYGSMCLTRAYLCRDVSYHLRTVVMRFLAVAAVYGYVKQPMKAL